MQIKLLEETDAPAAIRLLSCCMTGDIPRQVEEYLQNENVRAYGAYDPALCGVLLTLETPDTSDILEIAVEPTRRRRGIGTLLLQTATAQSRSGGAAAQMLEVRASNPALAFYEQLGFERIALRRGYYECPREDAVIMRRQL